MQTIRILFFLLAIIVAGACSKSEKTDAVTLSPPPISILDLPIGVRYIIVQVTDVGFSTDDGVTKKIIYQAKKVDTDELIDVFTEVPDEAKDIVGTEFYVVDSLTVHTSPPIKIMEIPPGIYTIINVSDNGVVHVEGVELKHRNYTYEVREYVTGKVIYASHVSPGPQSPAGWIMVVTPDGVDIQPPGAPK